MNNEEMAAKVCEQAFDKWINPEILKRYSNDSSNKLSTKISYAQVLFGIDGTHMVRLNNEVKGTFKVKLRKAVKKGDPILMVNIEDIFFADQDEQDKDFGHITIAQYEDRRSVSFSFLYGAKQVGKYLNLGEEYYNQACVALDGSRRACITLGMTAIENLIKARLAASPQINLGVRLSHSQVHELFSHFIDDNQALKLNKKYIQSHEFFKAHFNDVRYHPDADKVRLDTIKRHLRSIDELRKETYELVSKVDSLS